MNQLVNTVVDPLLRSDNPQQAIKEELDRIKKEGISESTASLGKKYRISEDLVSKILIAILTSFLTPFFTNIFNSQPQPTINIHNHYNTIIQNYNDSIKRPTLKHQPIQSKADTLGRPKELGDKCPKEKGSDIRQRLKDAALKQREIRKKRGK